MAISLNLGMKIINFNSQFFRPPATPHILIEACRFSRCEYCFYLALPCNIICFIGYYAKIWSHWCRHQRRIGLHSRKAAELSVTRLIKARKKRIWERILNSQPKLTSSKMQSSISSSITPLHIAINKPTMPWTWPVKNRSSEKDNRKWEPDSFLCDWVCDTKCLFFQREEPNTLDVFYKWWKDNGVINYRVWDRWWWRIHHSIVILLLVVKRATKKWKSITVVYQAPSVEST